MHLHRGTRPGALLHAESRLPGKPRGTDLALAILLFVERQPRPCLPLFRAGLFNPVVKARNQDLAIFVFEFGDDACQRLQRIGRHAAVHAGVQVYASAGGFQFGVNHAAQADAQRGQVRRKHFGIRHQRHIGLQPLRMLAHELSNRFAADFLFAFDEQANIDR